MDDLPLVPAMKIIDYLTIKDIVNLKLVNKWFNQFINENVRIKDLVIRTHSSPLNRWFHTYDLINLQNFIKYGWYGSVCLKLNINQPILSQLKQLYMCYTIINFETLNLFDRLVHLEIKYSIIKDITDNNVLSLPMLKILNLVDPNYLRALLIDSTKLQALKLCNVFVTSVHPESITYVEIYSYRSCVNFLHLCINLQHLFCHDLNSFDLNEFNLIKDLSKLKSIHFDGPSVAFDSLVKEKKRFNQDLKIYFLNLEFDQLPDGLDKLLNEVDEFSYEVEDIYLGKCLNKNLIQYYAQYYSRLADHCPFVESVDYYELERYFDQIPENFLKRFVNLTDFTAEKVNDLDQMIRVLGECRTITDLTLPSSLGQHFFDFHLYNLCPNIDTLDIVGDEILNCGFIFKFKNIRYLNNGIIIPLPNRPN